VLTPLDDSPWHQLPTTFDHVGTSDVRFFDRLWFAASDTAAGRTLQFTMGVYQNMNVVDGGFVVIDGGRQHNLRVSRQLRPTYDTVCGPLRIEVVEPLQHVHLSIAPGAGTAHGELDWVASFDAQEERHHFARSWGRVLEDYSRYDQIGSLSGWLEIEGRRIEVADWWACRDHSWGVRENVGIAEPFTGEVPARTGSMFAFLFYSTTTHGGHVQVGSRGGHAHMTAEAVDRATGEHTVGVRVDVEASFVDEGRPRRFDRATFVVTDEHGGVTRHEVEARGPAVAMQGLGYGGYDDGKGLGVYRGVAHHEGEVWDVSHPAEVTYPDGTTGRPVHRIQPVSVTSHGPAGISTGAGGLTFIAETGLDPDGRLRTSGGH
jgi:hypothetical protein